MGKRKLIVKVNLWPPKPDQDGNLPIKGNAVHPADKIDDKDFSNADTLITILKDWNKANREWVECSVPQNREHKGLVFMLTLEPYDNNQHELQGIVKHGEDETRLECFCSDKKLIDVIDSWNGEYLH